MKVIQFKMFRLIVSSHSFLAFKPFTNSPREHKELGQLWRLSDSLFFALFWLLESLWFQAWNADSRSTFDKKGKRRMNEMRGDIFKWIECLLDSPSVLKMRWGRWVRGEVEPEHCWTFSTLPTINTISDALCYHDTLHFTSLIPQ